MITKNYSVYIKHVDGTSSYLSARGRSQWKLRTAKKHLRDVTLELAQGDSKWSNVRYFALVAAQKPSSNQLQGPARGLSIGGYRLPQGQTEQRLQRVLSGSLGVRGRVSARLTGDRVRVMRCITIDCITQSLARVLLAIQRMWYNTFTATNQR